MTIATGVVLVVVGAVLLIIRRPLVKFQLATARELKFLKEPSDAFEKLLHLVLIVFSVALLVAGTAAILGSL